MARCKLHLHVAFVIASMQQANAADAVLTVIEDRGGSSALPYYQALGLPTAPANRAVAELKAPTTAPIRFSEVDFLPVSTPSMTPGTLTPRRHAAIGQTSLFIVGEDEQSRAWLRRNALQLRSLRALGIVVQVSSQGSLETLRRMVPELTLVAASGDDLAVRLGLKHYPALVTPSSIEQ